MTAAVLCPVLGHVLPVGGSPLQFRAGDAYVFDAADALAPLRRWRSAADIGDEALPDSVEALFDCQEPGGTTVTDRIKGTVLTAASGALLGQRAVGIWEGTSFYGRRAIELATATGVIAAASSTPYNFASRSFAILIVGRAMLGTGAQAAVLGNRNGSGAGYTIEITTAGKLRFTLSDGSTTKTVDHASSTVVDAGSWWWALVRCDRSAGTATIDTSLGGGAASVSLSGLGSILSADAFRLGALPSVAGHPRCQLERVVIWADAAAESLSGARLGSWWTVGRAPGWATYARTGEAIGGVVATDTTLGDFATLWTPEQAAVGYHALITDNAAKIGLLAHQPIGNLLGASGSRPASGWTPTSCTITASDRDDPFGLRDGAKLTKSGAAGKVQRQGTTLTAGLSHTFSAWIYWDGTNTAPRLRVRDAADTTSRAEATYSGPANKWQRLSVTWTSAAEAPRYELHPSDPATSVGAAWFAGACVTARNTIDAASVAGPFIASASLANGASIRATARGCRSGRGTFEVRAACFYQVAGAPRTMIGVSAAAGSDSHLRLVQFDGVADISFRLHNSAGTEVALAQAAGQSDLTAVATVASGKWDHDEIDGYSARVARNASSATTGTDLPTPNDAEIPAVQIGSSPSGSDMFDGLIARVRVWPNHPRGV